MSKNIILFEEEDLKFTYKFDILMNILITNQSNSRSEAVFFMTIFYLQIISAFFSEKLEIFQPKNSKSNNFLICIQKILRVNDLFMGKHESYKVLCLCLFFFIILLIFHFLFSILIITKTSFYSYNKKLINLYIKIFLYIAYNIIYDICFNIFGLSDNLELAGPDSKNSSNHIFFMIVSVINIIITLFAYIFLNIYYNDSFYLSNSYFAKMSCNYDTFWGVNCMIMSLFLSQIKSFTKELFLIYNIVISIILFIYYIKHYLYYDKYINIYTGIFHLLYLWTSFFSLIFSYIHINEKGIIYLITSIIICFSYININNRIESNIFLKTPFYKINNQFYLLFYFRKIYDLTNNVEDSYDDKSLLSGIIKMHSIECPNPNCLLKTKEDIYLPSIGKWNDKNKREVEDEVFLKNFLIIVMNYFLYNETCSADMYLNLSLYYLKIIGNYCQAIYYYKKVTELKLSLRENFSFIRLSIQISKTLLEKLIPPSEQCIELKHLDVSAYFKYESLTQKFLDEINNDVDLSLEFWKLFQEPYLDQNKKTDFNKIFFLTDKIGKIKTNIENMWNKLFKIYQGVNDYFELYLEYIEQINDDDLKKRDLESLRRKNDNYADHINNNFYNILFSKETGIIIASGDKGNEGIIELCNKEIENIFKYETRNLKGMNLTYLMPKLFIKDHSHYIENYFKIGKKKLIDKHDFYTFGKDKNNSIIKIKLALKLFPILNNNIYFVGLISKENIDDIILLDDKYNIQGMSLKLMQILNINNESLFQKNDIPFYVICKKFVNFYSIFLRGKKNENLTINDEEVSEHKDNDNLNEEKKLHKDTEIEKIHDNIEINENIELEYEIKLPQFLIDFSNLTNKNMNKSINELMSIKTEEEEEMTEIIEEYDEKDLLMEEERNKNSISKKTMTITQSQIASTPNQTATPTPTPTPIGDTISPNNNPLSDSIEEESNIKNKEEKEAFNIEREEEQIYKTRINLYKSLFNDGKINELEELIDNCNKKSSSIEYKFNFTFDKYIFGNKQLSYIVRCVENKNDEGIEQEESEGGLEKGLKYKKEKNESIKPLYELLEEERKEIIALPEKFLNLSLENKNFQKLLQDCKDDINKMSKTYRIKKDEVLVDENSSQTSQASFDNGLVKKNRIEEIRSNLLNNISNFYLLTYIKITIYLIGICAFIFCGSYLLFFLSLYDSLYNCSYINSNIYQSTLWTSELISIFVNIRIIYMKEIINKNKEREFEYLDFLTEGKNISEYYDYCIFKSLKLYDKLIKSVSFLEMEISNYLSDEDLDNIYWNNINVSYWIEENITYEYWKQDRESFPMSIAQLLSDSLSYLTNVLFQRINYNSIYFLNIVDNKIYFDYMTYIIIENGYKNILPNLFDKLMKIPNKLKAFNYSKLTIIDNYIVFFITIIFILNLLYYFLIYLTNKSVIEGIDKVSKIKFDKIEEMIKRLIVFNKNLKHFREKEQQYEVNKKENEEIFEDNKMNNEDNDNSNIEQNKIKNIKKLSFINNNGFNLDNKRYIPLSILKFSFIYPLIIIIYSLLGIVPIFSLSLRIVNNVNKLLTVQNYIFTKLIITSTSTIEIKCNISECDGIKEYDFDKIFKYENIQEVIKAINLFSNIKNFNI